MTSRRFDDGDTGFFEAICQVSRLTQAVSQVVLVKPLPQPGSDGIQVTPCQSSIGRETLAQDKLVTGTLEKALIVHAQEAANINNGIFLGTHGAAICQREHLACDFQRGFISIAWLTQLDEVGILGES